MKIVHVKLRNILELDSRQGPVEQPRLSGRILTNTHTKHTRERERERERDLELDSNDKRELISHIYQDRFR
jgi:hypothetical protein